MCMCSTAVLCLEGTEQTIGVVLCVVCVCVCVCVCACACVRACMCYVRNPTAVSV